MIDEDLVKGCHEHLARLMGEIKKDEQETAERVQRYDDKRYAKEEWRHHRERVEPLWREHAAVVKLIADYMGLQAYPQIQIPPI